MASAMFDYSQVDLAVDAIAKGVKPRAIIIFGSVADRTARDDSDIDMIVVMDTDTPYFYRNIQIQRILRANGLKVDRDVIVLTPDEFEERVNDRHSFIHEIYSKGYVAYEA